MTIFFTDTAKNDLYAINDFITADKPMAAAVFFDELLTRIELLKTNPFQCQKSYYSDRANVRDLVFKNRQGEIKE